MEIHEKFTIFPDEHLLQLVDSFVRSLVRSFVRSFVRLERRLWKSLSVLFNGGVYQTLIYTIELELLRLVSLPELFHKWDLLPAPRVSARFRF